VYMSWISTFSLASLVWCCFVCALLLRCVGDAGGCIALYQFVNVMPLCCDRVNSTISSVVCLGGHCIRVGGVEVLDRMEDQGGGERGLLLVGL
jgi:hypothetical protein